MDRISCSIQLGLVQTWLCVVNHTNDLAFSFHLAACTDPAGFFTARDATGARVGCISAVRFGDTHAHIGYFIVTPGMRKRGVGAMLWDHAMQHVRGRTLSLDAVQEQVRLEGPGFFPPPEVSCFLPEHRPSTTNNAPQVARYARTGFKQPAYWQLVFSGVPRAPPTEAPGDLLSIVDACSVPFASILAYDRRFFPAAREAFLSAWLATPGHVSVAALSGGELVGLAVGRPNHDRSCTKLGPVYAATPAIAWRLIHRLLSTQSQADGPGAPHLPPAVILYAPSANAAAAGLAGEMGLAKTWTCARMYSTDAPPDVAVGEMYSCASLELG